MNENILLKYEKTGSKKKLRINDKNIELDVYKIPISDLSYNKFNGRIATWLSNFEEKNNLNAESLNKNEFNELVEDAITNDNKDAMKKTKNNIKLAGQLEPGVVSLDGIVIDGNRRFTCLRKLSREENDINNFNFLEAVVIPYPSNNKKIMKSIELQIQMGKEERVDYDAIDKLVDIYKCIVDEKIFTIEEYAQYTGMKEVDAKIKLEEAYIMADYLEYINAPKKWHIAKEKKLEGSFLEIKNIKKSKFSDEIKEQYVNIMFDYLLISPKRDMGKFIRNDLYGKLKNSHDDDVDNFINDHIKNVYEPIKEIKNTLNDGEEFLKRIDEKKDDLSIKMMKNVDNLLKATELRKISQKVPLLLEEAIKLLNRIDIDEINNIYSDDDVDEVKRLSNVLRQNIENLLIKIK